MKNLIYNFGLKLWSNGILYLSDAKKLYRKGLYNFVELYIVPGTYEKLITSYRNFPAPYIIHCPHESHGFNLSDKNKEKYNLNIFKEVKKYADALKSKIIIIHSGSNGSIEESSRQISLLRDDRVVIENTSYTNGKLLFSGSLIQDIEYILNNNKIGFCLDISHAFCTANNVRANPLTYLKKFNDLKPALYHLTGGNINSTIDFHNHFSKSDYPWKEIFTQIKKGSNITIETDREKGNSLVDFKNDVDDINFILSTLN